VIDWAERTSVRSTGLALPRIGLGTASLGNLLEAMSDDDAVSVIRRALDVGITYIDTAPLYGHGLAESRVGSAIGATPRDQLVLSTKVGRLLREGAPRDETQYHDGEPFYKDVPSAGPLWDFSYNGVTTSLAESCARVGVDQFEILLLHDPDDHFHDASSTGYAALADLRAQGAVRAIGAGMNHTAVQTALVHECDLDVVLVAGRYTLLDQSALDALLPACVERDVAVVIGGVFNSGILADPSPGSRFDYVPASADVHARVGQLQEICRRHGVPLAAAALQFPFGHPQVRSVLVGPRSTSELDRNLELLAVEIPPALWDDLRRVGAIQVDAPVPV
jgi:D-threo-aldose 1-dehydrogenase